jgi:hypothetical protein
VCNAVALGFVLQASLIPINVRWIPLFRIVFYIPDRLLRCLGVMSVGIIICGIQMMLGILGTELGVHVALLNWFVMRMDWLHISHSSSTMVEWATLSIHVMCVSLCVLYALSLVSVWHLHQSLRLSDTNKSIQRPVTTRMWLAAIVSAIFALSPRYIMRFPWLSQLVYPGMSIQKAIPYGNGMCLDVLYPSKRKANSLGPVLM